MSLSLIFAPRVPCRPRTPPQFCSSRPRNPPLISIRNPKLFTVKSIGSSHQNPPTDKPRWEETLSTVASLYPLYVTVGGIVACVKPSIFSWFVQRGPVSYSFALGLVMLAMGLTLEFKDFLGLFVQRPFSILYGCVAQYAIMPAFGAIVSKCLGLPPSISVGLILLGCCPGGTASNVVTLIAKGDVPLSIVMTVCTTLGAVLLTPLLTKLLAGAYVPVDALKLSISTMQVVVAPILVGSYMQSKFPAAVKKITPFAPLVAVLTSSLLASSVFSENVVRFKSSMSAASVGPDLGHFMVAQEGSVNWVNVAVSVFLLHFAGFFVGYLAAAIGGFKESQRRAISIEHSSKRTLSAVAIKIIGTYLLVGMQNSSLGVVLATSHFNSPLVALPPAMSAIIMNIMGSSLGFLWRFFKPSSDAEQGADDSAKQG